MRTSEFLKDLLKDRSGGTAIEYGLIAALIVIAMIASLNSFANEAVSMWDNVVSSMQTVNAAA